MVVNILPSNAKTLLGLFCNSNCMGSSIIDVTPSRGEGFTRFVTNCDKGEGESVAL